MKDELVSFFITGEIFDTDELVKELLLVDNKEICDCVLNIEHIIIEKKTIPQYSSYANGTFDMLKYLRMSGDYGPTFAEIGEHFLERGHKSTAYIKYGENHAKLAALLGVVEIRKNGKNHVFLTDLGKTVEKLELSKQKECFIKLSARIPIVQEAIKQGISSANELEVYLKKYLSPITAIRRRRNTWVLIDNLRGAERDEL